MKQSSTSHVADRLLDAIDEKRAPVCVGIDPVVDKLPKSLRPGTGNARDAVKSIHDYCKRLIAAIQPYVPCIKFQSACFERYGEWGVAALRELIQQVREEGELQIILDSKRGDIGISAEHYAAAAFDEAAPTDWVTINSYLGADGIDPFLQHGGAFALVRTSNPGGDAIQNLALADGGTVAHAVAAMINACGSKYIGDRGYSALGAVVGATKASDAGRLRQIMPRQIFLVPGYGAQGGSVQDILPCFESDGSGAIITASRSVIFAFRADDPAWAASVGDAAAEFADDVGRAVGMR